MVDLVERSFELDAKADERESHARTAQANAEKAWRQGRPYEAQAFAELRDAKLKGASSFRKIALGHRDCGG